MDTKDIRPEDLPEREVIDTFFGVFRFLSNFYRSRIRYDKCWYPTVEHAYQAAKTLDPEEHRRVAECSTPGKAKQTGKHVTLRDDWEDVKVDIMRQLLREKFSNPLRGSLLLATGDALLMHENSHGDRFWGCELGDGLNILGNLLMEIREELRDSYKDYETD